MLEIKEAYQKLKESEEFKKEKGFLYLAFSLLDQLELENNFWQLDFYNKKRVNSYNITQNEIKLVKENEEVECKNKIEELNLDKFNLDYKELLSLMKEKLEFYKFRPQKYILILQDNYWNASIISTDFFILKLKVNAENKKIEECSTDHILNFQKRL